MAFTWTLAATALGTGLGAIVYAALASALWRRPLEGDARFGTRAFALYWALTGAFQAIVAAQHALAAFGAAPFGLALAVRYVGLVLATAGICALLCYIAYLRTGTRRWTRPLVAAYVLTCVLVLAHVWRSRPHAVALTAWSVDVAYAGDFMGGLFLPLMAMLLGVPIVAAVWYLTLVRKTDDRAQRYRIFAVGAGISLQLLTFLVARLVESEAWQLVSRTLLGIAVALLVFSAYRPGLAPLQARAAVA